MPKFDLALRLFGTFEALGPDGQPLAFRTDKIRAMLAFLAVEHDRPHRRDALAGLLWGESSQRSARQNLRMGLSRLRASLKPIADQPLLVSDRQVVQLQLRPERHFVDALQLMLPQLSSPLAAENYDLAKSTAAAYRGDFLAGLTLADSPAFNEWRVIKGELFHQQIMNLLGRLVDFCLIHRRWPDGERFALQQIGIDPWYEPAHRQLMQLYAAQSKPKLVLRQYEKLTDILAEEIGVEPDAQTTRLKDELLARNESHHDVIEGSPHNLPRELTPFIGREKEQQDLREMLLDPAYPLITLMGVGGIGKTRLALQCGASVRPYFPGGVWFVPLEELLPAPEDNFDAREQLAAAVARAVDFRFEGHRDLVEQLVEHLAAKGKRDGRSTLLILDNMEHVIEPGATLVLELMKRLPFLFLLVTSRQRVRLQSEYVFQVEGLPIPTDVELQSVSSVELFVERATRLGRGFHLNQGNAADVGSICKAVHGLPLGIELAASLVEESSCAAIARALQTEQRLNHLASPARDLPARHRTLRRVFDYSWDLLPPNLQKILAGCTIIRGRFGPAAAARICSATKADLENLLNRSLLRAADDGGYAFHPLIYEHAAEKRDELLTEREIDDLLLAHAQHYSGWFGGLDNAVYFGPSQVAIQKKISREMENIDQLWRWAAENDRPELILPTIYGIYYHFQWSAYYLQGQRWAGRIINLLSDSLNPKSRQVCASLLLWKSVVETTMGQVERALDSLSQAEAILTDLDPAETIFERAILMRETGKRRYAQNAGEAVAIMREASRLFAIADWLGEQTVCMMWLAYILLHDGRLAEAEEVLDAAIPIQEKLKDKRGQISAHSQRAIILATQEKYDEAIVAYKEVIEAREALQDWGGVSSGYWHLGDIYLQAGQMREAEDTYHRALEMVRLNQDTRGIAAAVTGLGRVFQATGRERESIPHLQEGIALYDRRQEFSKQLETMLLLAEVYGRLNQLTKAVEVLTRGLTIAREQGDEALADQYEAQLARVRNSTSSRS